MIFQVLALVSTWNIMEMSNLTCPNLTYEHLKDHGDD